MKFIYTALMLLSFNVFAQMGGSVASGNRGPQVDWSNLPQKVLELDSQVAALQSQNAVLSNQLNNVNARISTLEYQNNDLYNRLNNLEAKVLALTPKFKNVYQCTVSVTKTVYYGTMTTVYPIVNAQTPAQDENENQAKIEAKKACLDYRDIYGNRVESVSSCNNAPVSCVLIRINL